MGSGSGAELDCRECEAVVAVSPCSVFASGSDTAGFTSISSSARLLPSGVKAAREVQITYFGEAQRKQISIQRVLEEEQKHKHQMIVEVVELERSL